MLNHNARFLTEQAIKSIDCQTYTNLHVYLIDNGSSNLGMQAAVVGNESVTYYRSETNLGCAAGRNFGMRVALLDQTDYLLFLDNDVTLHPDMVSKLVACAESDSAIGAVSPKIFFADPAERIWFAGGRFKPWWGFARMVGWKKKDAPVYDLRREIDWVCGCAFMVKADVPGSVGPLDERYSIENEDVEWSLRIKKAGYRLVYCPDAMVWHRIGGSNTNKDSALEREELSVRNMLLLLYENLSLLRFILALLPFSAVWFGVIPFRHLLNGRYDMMAASFLGAAKFISMLKGRRGAARTGL